MSSVGRRMKDWLVVWNPTGTGGYGSRVFGDPREIRVRWLNRAVRFTGNGGDEQVSSAVIYSAEEIQLGAYVMLGRISDLPTATTKPTEVSGPRLIGQAESSANRRGDVVVYKALIASGSEV